MDKFSNHSLLQSKPNFVSSLNEFINFLKLTLDDLKAKQQTLKAQKKILTQNRTAKNYLKCQIYMLKKHIQRLDGFNAEVEARLNSVLKQEQSNVSDSNNKEDKVEELLSPIDTGDHGNNVASNETFRESAIDCGQLEENKHTHSSGLAILPHTGSGEGLDVTASSISSNSLQSAIDDVLRHDRSYTTDSITSTNDAIISDSDKNDSNTDKKVSPQKENCINADDVKADDSIGSIPQKSDSLDTKNLQKNGQDGSDTNNNSIDQELSVLLEDMKKMKRRCKRVLDVTDKYCVLNNETDLKLDLQQGEVADLNASLSKSPTTSPWSTRCSSACSSNSESSSPTNPDNTLTFEDEVDGVAGENKQITNLQLPSSINDKGLFKITLDSFGEHLGVLMKTYTRRHS